MEYKDFQGVKIPVLGLGTWKMGTKPGSNLDKQEIEAIKYTIELNMTHIDTAESYSDGHSEELVGEAIKDFKRKDLFITTKVSPSHFRFNEVLKSCEGSLKRLKLDYIDLYLLHWPNPSIPLKETMKAMDKLVEQGVTRFIGVSNFDAQLMEEAQGYSDHRIFSNQVEYSLFDKSVEEDILPYCRKQDIMLTAYSPLGQNMADTLKSNKLLNDLAQKYNKTPIQIALNYLIIQDHIVTIPKSSSKEHIKENLGAVGWKLEPKDFERLKKEF